MIAKDCRCRSIPLLIQRCRSLSFLNTLYSASALRLITPFKCGMSLCFLKAHCGASRCYAVALLVVNNESVASSDLGIGNEPSSDVALRFAGASHCLLRVSHPIVKMTRRTLQEALQCLCSSFSCLSSVRVKYSLMIFVTVFIQFQYHVSERLRTNYSGKW